MRLLIVTQKVDKNDAILGFFHRWIEEFARSCESVLVICLEQSAYSLPDNVEVLSLGKEQGVSRLKYIKRFYKYIWNNRREYDTVLVHMNPEYVVLGGPVWKFLGKKMALWYVHRKVNLKLKLAEKLVDVVLTSSKESFKLESKKVEYLGHGIDIDRFIYVPHDVLQPFSILHVGRISRIKNIDVIFRAARSMLDRDVAIRSIVLVGEPSTGDDRRYAKELKGLADKLGINELVDWRGSVPNREMLNVYADTTVTVNAAPDGGMDKVVLEALLVGRPTFFSNKAFREVLAEDADTFQFKLGDPYSLADKIVHYLELPNRNEIVEKFSIRLRRDYSVEKVVEKILANLL
jgi:glycosyltransferase involved in cell wall biosynthesis